MSLERAARTDAESPRLGHRPALDGLRGVAIALVVLNHTVGFPTTGFTGVELFFVLSGFLITTLLLEEHARSGRISLGNFYRRRALRLLPALVVLLAAFLAYALVKVLIDGGSLQRPLFGVAAGLGYFTNIALAVEPSAVPNELRHLWSLAIEEQFYLVWPPVLFVVLGARRRLAIAVLLFAGAFAVAQLIRLSYVGASQERIAFGTDTRSTSIVIGSMVAICLLTSMRTRLDAFAHRVLPLAIACFVSLLMVFPRLDFFSAWLVLFGLSSALLLIVALDDRSALARVLSITPLTYLGRISYSLYLWHVAIYWAFGLYAEPELMDLPALALSFACAVASYHLIEMPFLRRKRRFRAATPLTGGSVPALSPVRP